MELPPSVPTRCPWVLHGNSLYEAYHDKEWGIPVHDDRKHFEFLILEGAQAGLSWITILQRREGYKRAFADFDPAVVAGYDERKIAELMQDEQIIRNKLKIRSSINNARCFIEVQKEFGSFDVYVWSFVGGSPLQNHRKNLKEIPAETQESKNLSKDLKKRGFSFVGPVTMYAYMQATGLVDDHTVDCFCYKRRSQEKTWEVYIILTASNKLYTGITTDLDRRFKEHKEGKKGASFFHLSQPVGIVYRETHPDRSTASRRESAIKKMNRKEKESLIQSYKATDLLSK